MAAGAIMNPSEIFYISPSGLLWEVREHFRLATAKFPSREDAHAFARWKASQLTYSEILIVGLDGRPILSESLTGKEA